MEDDETGKPTVVNGEHLDPYNVSRWQMVDLRDADADVFLLLLTMRRISM